MEWSSIFWSKRDGIGPLRNASFVICYVARARFRTLWSRTGFGATRPHFRICCPKSDTNADTGITTGLKTPTSQLVNASGACAGSSHPSRPNSFSPFTASSLLISDRDATGLLLLVTELYAGNAFVCGIPRHGQRRSPLPPSRNAKPKPCLPSSTIYSR
jgi:hypothetical protein